MDKESNSGLSVNQIAVVVGVVLAVYLLAALGLMVREYWQLQGILAEQERQVAGLKTGIEQSDSVKAGLEQGTPLLVEEEAREVFHLAREGDVPIVVDQPMIEEARGEILRQLADARPSPSRPHWQEWWDLFVSP